jgi:error-prone DNA polymerase
MTRAEQLVLDYAYTGVSVDDHPMKILRPRLSPHIKSARALEALPHGARVSAGGMVICRQRPGTASGVVFVTLEDEEGFINLILWAQTFERFRHVATTSSMLLAHGKVERQGQVIYVVPTYLEPLVAPAETSSAAMPTMSRDFH